MMKNIFLLFLLILIMCPSAWATTYYISDADGDDSNPGTLNSEWKTISKANATLQAGDTVYIKTGTYYNQYIYPINSGTSGNIITYSNYNDDAVMIRDASYGVRISNQSYISVTGIDFFNLDHFVYIYNGSYNVISYCTFVQMRNYTWHGTRIWNDSQYNWFHHNTFSDWGYYTATSDKGSLMDIGDETVSDDASYYNLLEDNILHAGGHHVLGIYTRYTVVRNNYFHNEPWSFVESTEYGDRNVLTQGHDAGGNLIEGNRFAFAAKPPDDNGAVGMDLRSPDNIVRKNVFYYNGGSGIGCNTQPAYTANPTDNNLIYNNVFYHNGYDTNVYSGYRYGFYYADWGTGDPVGNIIKNNIFYDNDQGAINYYNVSPTANTEENNWIDNGDPLFVSPTATDPFDQYEADFNLQAESDAIDAGTWLTTVVGSGSGTSFQVQNATYFMDGWGIIQGDEIQFEGQSTTALITDISGNTITVDTELSWTADLGISLVYESTAPDLGAYEYVVVDAPDNAVEAEGGELVAPMVSVEDVLASEGFYIHITDPDDGSATYTVSIPSDGTYKIIARVYASDAGSDSFFINMNSTGDILWDLNPAGISEHFGVWREDEVTERGTGSPTDPQYDPRLISLTSGDNTMVINGREANTKIDYFYFEKMITSGSMQVGTQFKSVVDAGTMVVQ